MAGPSAIRAGRAFVELFADDSMLIRTLRRAEAKVVRFGSSIKAIGRRLATLGLSAGVPFAASMKVFSDFDDQMRTVQAVTGATGKEFDMLTEKAKYLGRTTSFTTSQVAAGMVELGRAGFAPQEIDSAIAGMLNLARATGTDLATATEIAGNTLRRFNLDASEMTRVSDVLTATANLSAQTLFDLGESLKDSGPLASAYGMSLEDLTKTLGALANFGIKGSMAGTTMKNIMTRIADPKIQKQLDKLGVSVSKAGKLRNVADIMRDVGDAVSGMATDKQLATFKNLFGLRAIAGGAKLTVAQFDRLNEGIDTAAGRAAATAKGMDAGIGGSFRMLWSAVEGVAIAVGEALAPSLQKMTDWFTVATSGVVEYLTKNKQIVIQAAKIVSAVTGVGIGLFVLGGTLIGVGKTIGIIATIIASVAKIGLLGFSILSGAISAVTMTVGTVISAFSGVAGMIGMVFGGIATAVGTAFSVLATVGTAVFGTIGTVIAAAFSPLGLVLISLGAVAGACFLVYRNASAIGNDISKVFSSIVGAIKQAASSVCNFLNRFTEFKIIFGTINIVRGGLDLLGKTILWIGNSIVKPVFSVVFSVFRQLAGVVLTVAKTVGSALAFGFRGILGIVSAVFGGVVSVVATVAGKAVSVVGSVFSGIASLIGRVLSPIVNIPGAVFRGILRFISPIGTALKTVAGWIVSFSRSFFVVESAIQVVSLLGKTVSGMVGIFSTVAGGIISTFFTVVKNVPGILLGMVRFVISLPGKILSVFRAVPQAVVGMFSGIVGTVRGIVSGIGTVFSGIASFAVSGWSSLVGTLSTVFSALGGIVADFGNFFLGVFSGTGSAVDWFKEKLGGMANFATESFGAIATALGRGDIEAALGVVWASLKLIWVKGSTFILSTWYWVVDTLQTAWANCVFKISELLLTSWYGVQRFWTETVYTMQTLWTGFMDSLIGAWQYAEKLIKKGVGYIKAIWQGTDPKEVLTGIDEEYDRKTKEREQKRMDSLNAIQRNRDSKQASLEAEKQGAIGILKDDLASGAADRQATYQSKLDAQQKELDDAKTAYDAAINRARTPETAEKDEEPTLVEKLQNQFANVIKGFKTSGGIEGMVAEKATSKGTFSAFEIGNFDDSIAEDQLSELQQHTALLRTLKFKGIPWKED